MTDRFMRLATILEVTTLSRAELYRRIKAGEFPKPVNLSTRITVWLKQDVDQWFDRMTGRKTNDDDLWLDEDEDELLV